MLFCYNCLNEVKIIIEGVKCKHYRIVCDNCLVDRCNCIAKITPLDSSIDLFSFYVIVNKDTVEENRLLLIDEPKVFISPFDRTSMSLTDWNFFRELDSVYARSSNNTNIIYTIDSFVFKLERNGMVYYERKIVGNKFNDDDRIALREMIAYGDIIKCNNISIKGSDLINRVMNVYIDIPSK